MKISEDEAIQYLDNAAKKYNGTRDDHVILQAAIQIVMGIRKQRDELLAEKKAMKDSEKLTPISGGGGDAAEPAESE